MVGWSRRNRDVTDDLNKAADTCHIAWGYGGSEADGDMRRWSNWFDDVVDEFFEIYDAEELEEDTYDAAIDCCADILQMEQVDHGYHIHNIVRIRKALMPDTDFYDWPFDVSHLWDSDDENEGIFHFEL